MTTLLSRKSDPDRAKGVLEDVIARLRGLGEGTDVRSRVDEAGGRIGDAGGRLGDAAGRIGEAGNRIVNVGNQIVESGAETARNVVREARTLPALAQGAATRAKDVASDVASSVPIRIQVGKPPRRPLLPLVLIGLATAAIGAVIAFMFDPQMGRGRRAVAGDRAAAAARHASRWSARQRHRAAATATALREQLRSSGTPSEPVDEVALANRVRTELFRDPSVDKGSINVNAERDVVFLRGTVPSDSQAGEIGRRVEGIDGVRKVVNLLHVPGAPVPVMAAEEAEEGTGAESAGWAVPH